MLRINGLLACEIELGSVIWDVNYRWWAFEVCETRKAVEDRICEVTVNRLERGGVKNCMKIGCSCGKIYRTYFIELVVLIQTLYCTARTFPYSQYRIWTFSYLLKELIAIKSHPRVQHSNDSLVFRSLNWRLYRFKRA